MSENTITIDIVGTDLALATLRSYSGSVRRGARIAMNKSALRILGRTKQGFGQTGRPQRRSGALSRSIVRVISNEEGAIVGQVGSTMPYKTGYAAQLEKGGPVPAMTITAKKGKALVFFKGFAGITYRAHLAAGMQVKSAIAETRKTHHIGKFVNSEYSAGGAVHKFRYFQSGRGQAGNIVFARSVKIPARYQRAMPYLRPSFEAERPQIAETFDIEIRDAIARKQMGSLNSADFSGEAS